MRDAPTGLQTVILRPRFVWGPGDTTVLPELVGAVRSGRFAWPGGGRQLTSTTHVQNLIDAILLVAGHQSAHGPYFVADDGTTTFRTFVTELLATQGIAAPSRSLPLPVARLIASGSERLWQLLRRSGKPPLTRQELALMFVEVTLNDARIRTELGYRPRLSRQDGLAQLAAAPKPDPVEPIAGRPGPLSTGA